MSEHDARINVKLEGYEKFGDVARIIGRVDRNFPKWIQAEIEKEAKQLQREAQKSIKGQRGESKAKKDILGEIAEGIQVEKFSEDGGDGMHIITSMPEENEENLPRGFDTTYGGFWHPLFAKKDELRKNWKWYHQDGKYSWWVDVMEPSKVDEELEPKMQAIGDRAAEEIGSAGETKA
ncbi:hypothetical protein [Nocardia jiangxiensis]|uniref:hypothetical protein n=1 Tax=Nocardia jiangxiensis TaxID=282685 RepID=UPI0002F7F4BC|nr:hypothetical protein [Nocardia jiangxiensis]